MADDKARALVKQAQAGQMAETNGENPIGGILHELIGRGVTEDNAAALEKVCDLYVKMDAVQAKKAFAAAKAALQAELPVVAATRVIPDKQGNVRSVFAAYEDIMEQVKPYLVRHGFSVSFTMHASDNRMEAVCTLTHAAGHCESNSFSVRIGSGPPGCSEAQSDGAARSYARRGALCDALNIVIDKDTDARMEGATISEQEAADLEKQAAAAGIRKEDFLRLADAETFADIRQSKLSVLKQVLRERGKEKRQPDKALKLAWAKARYGDALPSADLMRREFREWVEHVLQRDVPDIDALDATTVRRLTEWLEKEGADTPAC